jgi:hypothetical protein
MFTLNTNHFREGKPLALVCAYNDQYYNRDRQHGCSYVFSPLGEVNSTTFAFRVTRTVCTFTDSYPSRPDARDNLTRIWERVDVPLSVKTTLTAHFYAIVRTLDDEEELDHFEERGGTEWIALTHAPTMKPHFYLGNKIVNPQ